MCSADTSLSATAAPQTTSSSMPHMLPHLSTYLAAIHSRIESLAASSSRLAAHLSKWESVCCSPGQSEPVREQTMVLLADDGRAMASAVINAARRCPRGPQDTLSTPRERECRPGALTRRSLRPSILTRRRPRPIEVPTLEDDGYATLPGSPFWHDVCYMNKDCQPDTHCAWEKQEEFKVCDAILICGTCRHCCHRCTL